MKIGVIFARIYKQTEKEMNYLGTTAHPIILILVERWL